MDLLRRNREFLRPWEPIRLDTWFTLDAVRAELAVSEIDREADRAYAFGIWDRADGALVGRIALSTVVRGAWHNANVGYFVDHERGGRGYGTHALRLALGFAFEQARLHRVQAAVMPRNARSIRVVEKNGFRFEGLAERYLQIEGVWEDHRIYAITVEEWRRQADAHLPRR